MSRKKKTPETVQAPPHVTLIEDPFGIHTMEIAEAQNNPEELQLDEDFGVISDELGTDEDEDFELNSPAIEEQLERLASAISQENKKFEETVQEIVEEDPAARLAAEIEEDLALQKEEASARGEEEALNAILGLGEVIRQEISHEEMLDGGTPDETAPGESLTDRDRDDEALTGGHDEAPAEETGPIEVVTLDLDELQSCIEAILFISDKPLSLKKLQALLGPFGELDLFSEALSALMVRYQATHHGFELVEVAEGYQFRTKLNRADLARKLVKTQTQRLSAGSMETLAIVAYRQPVMKEEIDKVRGVDSSYFIRQLIDRKLIEISGRSDLPGRPLLYSATSEFLEVFGLKDFSAMPSLRELEQMIPASQSDRPEDEDPKVREMRRLVSEMKSDRTSALYYNPKEDDSILKEIREKVSSIPTSTPYLDELKAAEEQAKKQAEMAANGTLPGGPTTETL